MHRILVLLPFTGVLICSVARGQLVESLWHVCYLDRNQGTCVEIELPLNMGA